jgi:serpin B
MGMPTAFNETTADFSGMTGKPNLYISRVLHKAWIEVDEKGSEAAAATAVVMDQLALPVNVARPKIFRADHPFFFVIEDKQSGEILFMGRVVDPGKGQ